MRTNKFLIFLSSLMMTLISCCNFPHAYIFSGNNHSTCCHTAISKQINFNNNIINGHEHNDVEFQPWTSNNSLPTSGDYYLNQDVTIPYSSASYASVLTGNLNLCLNGHIIKLNSSNYNGPSAFYVGVNKTLKIFDCNETEETMHYYKFYRYTDWGPGSYASDAITIDDITPSIADGKMIKVPGGAIFDASNNRSAYGGAIQVDGNNAHFYLYGGNIIGNYCSYGGGAVAVINGSSFEMNGGRIVGNSGYEAGGFLLLITLVLRLTMAL